MMPPPASHSTALRLDADWLLTPKRAAVHVATATAVVADLHLGYDLVRRRGGEAVPRADLHPLAAELEVLVRRHGARRLVVAGDLVEGPAAWEAVPGFLQLLSSVGLELAAVVPGNHDRQPTLALPWHTDGYELAGWRVVHGDGDWPAGRLVLGHFHPCVRRHRGAAPCFLVRAGRLVLPAFSLDARGVNVAGNRRWRGYRRLLIIDGQVRPR